MNPLDLIINILLEVDPKGTTDFKKYLDDLEKLGVRWNAQANRFQEVKSVTGGTGFVSQDAVKKTLQELIELENKRVAAKTAVVQAEKAVFEAQNRNIDAGKAVLQYANDFGTTIDVAANKLAGMAAGFGRGAEGLKMDAQAAQAQGFEPMAQSSEVIEKNTGKIAGHTGKMNKNMADLRSGFLGFQLMMTGMAMERAGQALLSPIQKYTEFAGMADPASREWLKTQKDLEMSIVRMGSIMTRQLLPAFKQLSEYAGDMADFVEQHPEIAGAAVKTGVGLLGGGGILMVLGQVWSGVFALRQLFGFIYGLMPGVAAAAAAAEGAAAAGATGAAAGATGAAAAGTLTAGTAFGLVGGAVIAAGAESKFADVITDAIRDKLSIEPASGEIGDVVGNWLLGLVEMGIAGPAMPLTIIDQMNERIQTVHGGWANFIQDIITLGDGMTELQEAAAGASSETILAAGALEAYTEFMETDARAAAELAKNLAEAEDKFGADRAKFVEDHGEDMADREEKYLRERSKSIDTWGAKMAQDEADHLRERQQFIDDFERDDSQRVQDHNKEMADLAAKLQSDNAKADKNFRDDTAEAWEDYYKKLRQLERDHTGRVEDLVGARDAIGLAEERRRYARERDEAYDNLQDKLNDLKDQRAEEKAAAQQRFQEEMAEKEAQFQLEQQRRREEHDLELARRDEEHKIEMERRKAEHDAELAARDDEHKIEMEKREEEFQEELQERDQQHQKEMQDMRRDYEEDRQLRKDQLKRTMQDLYTIERDGQDKMVEGAKEYVKNLLLEADKLKASGVTTSLEGTRAEGGYTWPGNWKMHDEFVLSPGTTKAAERMLGGRLSQQNLLRAMSGNNSNLNMYFPAGVLNSKMRTMFADITREALNESLASILEDTL